MITPALLKRCPPSHGCPRAPGLESAVPRVVLQAALLLLAGSLAGCGRDSNPDPSGNVAAAGQAATVESQPRQLAVPEGANTDVVLQQLNRELVRWIVQNKRVPASFEEFVASSKLTVPPPPAGKRYVIGNDKKIVLR